MLSTLSNLNREIAELVERTKKSLVEVADGRGRAAGTIWHSQGLIVTNAHIVQTRCPTVTLVDGRNYDARVLAYDSEADLAALSIYTEGLDSIALGDSRELVAGQFVVAMGHPWGIKGAATAGIFMGSGIEHLRISYAQSLLAVNLRLRPGNSGGPLVDVQGRLIGINTMMTGPDSGTAIPVNLAKAFLKDKLGSLTR